MNRSGSPENGDDALWSPGRMMTGRQMLPHLDSRQKQSQAHTISGPEDWQKQLRLSEERNRQRLLRARMEQDEPFRRSPAETPAHTISEQEQANYQTQLRLIEQQNKKRLMLARTEQYQGSRRSPAETPAQPINGPHALQEHQSGPVMREAQDDGRIEAARAQITETSEESSSETSAQYGNNNYHAGAQKRKRDNNDEGRLIQTYSISSDITSGGPNLNNVVNLVPDRDKELPPHHDLKVAEKTVSFVTVKSSADVPEDVRKLCKEIQGLARVPRGVIPVEVEDQIQLDADNDLDDLDVLVAKKTNGISKEELLDEFKALRGIRDSTVVCKTQHLHEPSWNERVHSRMLEQAIRGCFGVEYHNTTCARVIKELVGSNKYGEVLKQNMIDYAISLGPPLVSKGQVMTRLAASPQPFHRTINPFEYSPLCHNPIAVSLKTRSPNYSREHGEVQLSIWVAAHFNRLRVLTQDPVRITLPLILVSDEHWKLLFARDLEGEIQIIDTVHFGSTVDIIGCYTILRVLRLIVEWAKETFLEWFKENVLEP